MGLFSKKKEGEEAAAAPAPAPAVTAPTVEVTDKKEPLLPQGEDGDAPVAVPNPTVDPEKGVTGLAKNREQEAMKKLFEKAKVATLTCCGMPPIVKYFLAAATVSGVIIFGLMGSKSTPLFRKERNIAMIGNSYFFVNDLPRLMESISDGYIYQDSCLHGSGSLLNILKTGNGMYYKWNTENAFLSDVVEMNENGQGVYLYDYGACSVPQLLLGQDSMLSYQNVLGAFLNDGNNPCIQDKNYLQYQYSFNYSEPWDAVVMADQSKRMSFDETRKDAFLSLNYTYGPIIKQIGATPIFVQTHAFWSMNANMTGLTDVPTFTGMIMEGAEQYKQFVKSSHGLKAHIAPVGDAFLTVWEEDYSLWRSMFLMDDIHPSPKGSYLYALVIYATVYGSMPDKDVVLSGNSTELFSHARKLQTQNVSFYPNAEEEEYLYDVAKRVVLKGYHPSYTRNYYEQEPEEYDEDEEEEDEFNDDEYGDDGQ